MILQFFYKIIPLVLPTTAPSGLNSKLTLSPSGVLAVPDPPLLHALKTNEETIKDTKANFF